MEVQILNRSINKATDDVLTTYLIDGFPRPILAQLNTHRVLSKNAESTRARPVHSVIDQVWNDPYLPLLTKNQKGMSGELLSGWQLKAADLVIDTHKMFSIVTAQTLAALGVHKQDANQYLTPYMRISILISGTEWDNFFDLRCDKAHAHPAIFEVADRMRALSIARKARPLSIGMPHLPWPDLSINQNVAKCLRVSYAKHGGDLTEAKAKEMADRAYAEKHFSAFEHIAFAAKPTDDVEGNFKGFYQLRHVRDIGLDLD